VLKRKIYVIRTNHEVTPCDPCNYTDLLGINLDSFTLAPSLRILIDGQNITSTIASCSYQNDFIAGDGVGAIYFTTQDGLFKCWTDENGNPDSLIWHYDGNGDSDSSANIIGNGDGAGNWRVIYRNNNRLYAGWDLSSEYRPLVLSSLPSSTNPPSLNPAYLKDGSGKIIIGCSNTGTIHNLFVFVDWRFYNGAWRSPTRYTSTRIGETTDYLTGAGVTPGPYINGSATICAFLASGGGQASLYVMAVTESATTTTTTTPTTTTTTTTRRGYVPPSTVVTTVVIREVPTTTTIPSDVITSDGDIVQPETGGLFVIAQETNASDSPDTKASVFSESATFGTLAPGETSESLIVALNVPNVKGITNIKLGLINAGELEFNTTMFGVGYNADLISNYELTDYFQGVNANETPNSPYNISVPNTDLASSNYVYLNVDVPINNIPGPSVLRWKWFFDFAE